MINNVMYSCIKRQGWILSNKRHITYHPVRLSVKFYIAKAKHPWNITFVLGTKSSSIIQDVSYPQDGIVLIAAITNRAISLPSTLYPTTQGVLITMASVPFHQVAVLRQYSNVDGGR